MENIICPPPHNKNNMTEVMIMANLNLKREMAGLWTENILNNAQIERRRKWEDLNKRENDYTFSFHHTKVGLSIL